MTDSRASCRIPRELDAELVRVSRLTDLDRSDLIRKAIKNGLPIVERQFGQAPSLPPRTRR